MSRQSTAPPPFLLRDAKGPSLASNAPAWVLGVLGAALGVPLAVFAWTGAYSRYVADDYCWAGVLRVQGFFASQMSWYTTYSPRYAFTFLVNLVELAGPAIVPFLPTVALITALAVTTWTLTRLRFGQAAAFVAAEALLLATLYTAPDLGQSLYWQTGMLTYLLPLVLCTFLVGWIAHNLRHCTAAPWRPLVSGLVTFVAGGLSETYLVPQNVGLSLSVLATVALTRGMTRRVLVAHLLAALAGGVLALAVIVVAPSTAGRVGGPPADLWLALSASIATGAYQVLRLVRWFAPAILLCLALPTLLHERPRISRQWFLGVSTVAALTLPFCYFPSFYAQNGNPPARSLIVPGTILTGYLIFAGHSAAQCMPRLPRQAVVLAALVLALVPLGVALTSLDERAQAAEYASVWDAEDQAIRASRDAGETDLTVSRLPRFLGENFVGPNRSDWFNACVARYYSVQSIASGD